MTDDGYEEDEDEGMRVEYVKQRWLSLKSVAKMLDIPLRTAERWRAEGRLPAPDVRLNQRVIRWTLASIERYAEAAEQATEQATAK